MGLIESQVYIIFIHSNLRNLQKKRAKKNIF